MKIQCPQCNNDWNIAEAFPGSKVICPSCGCNVLLNITTVSNANGFLFPPTSQVTEPSQEILWKQAVGHLEAWLDVSFEQIQSALDMIHQGKAYNIWHIPKGDSGLFREITAPCDVLKIIQRRILDRLLYRIPSSNASHGFIPGRSIVTNASYHLKTAVAVLNLDLKDAFPSITSRRVKQLCVRYLKTSLQHLGMAVSHQVIDIVIDLIVELTTYNNQLPQGSPCSGYLLNLACMHLDKEIYRVLSHYGEDFRYSRYADDMTISAPIEFPEQLSNDILKAIDHAGFQVNPKKIHYAVRTKGQKLEVTGLILEKGKVRIPNEKLEQFRIIIYQASQINTEDLTLEKRLEIQSIISFIKMVYDVIPFRIWKPYQIYLEKHNISLPKEKSRWALDLYPI